jgi:hypothetical protein
VLGPCDASGIVDKWDVPAQIKAAAIFSERAAQPTHVAG